MPQGRSVPGSAHDWLARAKGDLALAKTPLPKDAFYEDLCFHCQQAAEKAIKAVYQHKGWTFRYTHDLDDLLTGLRQQGQEFPPEVQEASLLSNYAWEARYPGLNEPITDEEYSEAIHQAEQVVTWAEHIITKL